MKKIYLSVALLSLSLHALAWEGASWMSELPDNAYVARVSIPGTHDSATGQGWPTGSLGPSFSQTQDLTISQQLALGVRALDIRPGKDGDVMYCAHGITNTTMTLKECLDVIKTFLTENPQEFIVIHLYPGNNDVLESSEFAALLNEYKEQIVNFRRDLTVGDMRGKMLVLSRSKNSEAPFSAIMEGWSEEFKNVSNRSRIIGTGTDDMNSGKLFVQDVAKTDGDNAQNKVKYMKNLFDFTTGHQISGDAANLVWAFNFASAYSGTLSSSESYKENAKTHNKLIADYFGEKSGPSGLVMMDYVGLDETNGNAAVKAIIDSNFAEAATLTPADGKNPVFTLDQAWMQGDALSAYECGGNKALPIIADFDGDGRMDAFVSGQTYEGFWNGEGWAWDWNEASYMALNKGFGHPQGFVAYDNSGVAYGQDADPSNAETHLPIIYGAQVRALTDLNQDGAVDFIVWDCDGEGWGKRERHTAYNDINSRVYLNNGDGSQFSPISGLPNNVANNKHGAWDCSLPGKYHRLSIADANMDGYPDILMNIESGTTYENNQFAWYDANGSNLFLNNGDGTFSRKLVASNRGFTTASLFGDFNCDGYPDILLNGYHDAITGADGNTIDGGYELVIMVNDGKGNFSVAYHDNRYTITGDESKELSIHVLDYDQDGKMDILLSGTTNSNSFNNSNGRDGKVAFILHNDSEDGNVAFSEVLTNIHPASEAMRRTSILADFNGDGFVDYLADGWGPNSDWSNGTYLSYSTGKDTYELHNGVLKGQMWDGEEDNNDDQWWITFGDVDGDGMLDIVSPKGVKAPRVYLNRTLRENNQTMQVPSAPTNIEHEFDKETKRVTLTWDEQYTESGSKAIYNTYIRRKGEDKVFMRVPAIMETGKLKAYTEWSSFLPSATCFFDNLEENAEYELGVQSVGYNYGASEFTVYTFKAGEDTSTSVGSIEAAKSAKADVYTLQGVRVAKGVEAASALDNLPAGIYIVGGKKVIKK